MSSSDIAIRAEGLGKCFQIYATPRDRLKQFVVPRVQRLAGRPPSNFFREFWAVRDLSFEVRRGETVGIIGRNGSGKSTLLQMICGTLTPTVGRVETNGRIAALLELGSGFNPEFTGRDNVYMNAALLGLQREEIERRFDAIAAFADIGQFMDQPVKTYSSGMFVRLAFAVIAHVDADILVVDEALSVGDAVFTQKCMRFIRSFQERGTLLFVSHDMAAVQNLCRSAIWMSGGNVRQAGPSKAVAEEYLRDTFQQVYGNTVELKDVNGDAPVEPAGVPVRAAGEDSQSAVVNYESRMEARPNLGSANGWKTGGAELLDVRLERLDGAPVGVFEGGERVRMVIRAKAHSRLEQPILGFILKDRLGQDLFGENTLAQTAQTPFPVESGQAFVGEFQFRLPMLLNGQYAVMASVADGDLHNNVQHHWLHDALILNVSSSKVRWGLVGVPFERMSLALTND